MTSAISVRVSTDRQTLAQPIDQQIERLRLHLKSEGQELKAEDIFRDDGYSGATLNRPGLDQLRDQLREGDIERVLIASPDRLARNYVHQMVLLEEFARYGCQVDFLDQPIGQDPPHHLLLQMRGAVAEYARTLIAERMRRGRQVKLRAGLLLPWPSPPYGYRVHPDRPRAPAGVEREPTEGGIVQELFRRYVQDQETLVGLSKYLLHLGMKSPRGKQCWRSATLRGLLSNPAYTGNVYVDRQQWRPARRRRSATHPIGKPAAGRDPAPPEAWTLATTIPALVSQADFDAVQTKLSLNQQRASRNNKAHTYVLRALVSCGRCQSACTGLTSSSGHSYDRCWRSMQGLEAPSATRCPARYSPADQLDALVWQDLCELLAHPEWIGYALERAHGGHWLPQELQARKETLRHAQTALAHQIERLTEAYLREVMP